MKFEYRDANGNMIQLQTFLFRRSWSELIKPLPDDQAGQLIKAFLRYADGEPYTTDPELDPTIKMMTRELRSSTRYHIEKIKRKEKEQRADFSTMAAPTAAADVLRSGSGEDADTTSERNETEEQLSQ